MGCILRTVRSKDATTISYGVELALARQESNFFAQLMNNAKLGGNVSDATQTSTRKTSKAIGQKRLMLKVQTTRLLSTL